MRLVRISAPFAADPPSINTPLPSTPNMANSQSGLQSGITVSPALVTAFNEASESPTIRALKIDIVNESLEPNGTLERSSTEQEDFSQLQEWLPDNEASYTIYFLDTPPENYIFISYVPDTSNVRSKMLYASSRATLVSTLGLRGQRLAHQIIATSKSDLTFPVLTPDTIPSLSDLSLREKEIAEIKAAEAEGAHGTSKRSINLMSSSGVAFPVSEDARNALSTLVHPQGDPEGEELVQLCIDEETVELAAVNQISKGEEVRDIIFEDEPRYTFFRFLHDYKGSEVTSILFIYSCPASSSIKQRMLYASSKAAILSVAAELGVKVDTKIETSEVDELTLKFFTREVHGVEETVEDKKKTFARPRGPPKRVKKVAETEGGGNEDSATE